MKLTRLRNAGRRTIDLVEAMLPASGPRDGPHDPGTFLTIAGIRGWSDRDVVFDVGASDGRTVRRLLRHLPAAPRIFAFEPVTTTFADLEAAAAAFATVECVRIAMGSEAGERAIHINESAVLNSFVPGWGCGRDSETVPVTTVDRFAEERRIERIALLKIDAEGHDLEVAFGARRLLEERRIDLVLIEVGLGAGERTQPGIDRVKAYLSAFDYQLHSIHNQCHAVRPLADGTPSATEVLVHCDALFVNGAMAATG